MCPVGYCTGSSGLVWTMEKVTIFCSGAENFTRTPGGAQSHIHCITYMGMFEGYGFQAVWDGLLIEIIQFWSRIGNN